MTAMTAKHSTNALSAERQAGIVTVAERHGVRELWLFGSAAAHGDQAAPNDIDIALLGVPNSNKEAVATSLQEEFPGCRTDSFTCYTNSPAFRTSRPLHFVLAHDEDSFYTHPISISVHRGICLWRA